MGFVGLCHIRLTVLTLARIHLIFVSSLGGSDIFHTLGSFIFHAIPRYIIVLMSFLSLFLCFILIYRFSDM